ncbi:MAG: hypothetical protein IPK28_22470 [Devosia sp.]|nr:hypothetical protein [Devosia sp.]
MRAKVGPGYIAVTRMLSRVVGLGPAESLIILSRLTFFACALLMLTVALRQRAGAGIAFQAALAAVAVLALVSSVWLPFTDIPWTHFVAAALLGAIVVVGMSGLSLRWRSALIGALAIALAQTRQFEAMVALVAAMLVAPLALARHWQVLRARPVIALRDLALPLAAGAVAAFVVIGVFSHNWSFFRQYQNGSGMVLTPQLAPTKAIQLFWDTCYATLCDLTAAPTTGFIADSYNSWKQPLLLQLPGLAGAVAGLAALVALRPRHIPRLPIGIVFACVTGGGLVLAYVSGAPSGSPHLRYGFFRDFIPPLVLLTTAFVGVLAVWRDEMRRSTVPLVAALAVFFVTTLLFTGLRTVGLPRIGGPDIARFETISSCIGGKCAFELRVLDAAGQATAYDDLALVICTGSRQPEVVRISALSVDATECASLVAYPLASGLLYTPLGKGFERDALDLTLPSDTSSVP